MRREATLVPQFAGGPYGPGETVEGVLVAREPLERARRLNAYLRYVDRSPSFSGAETYDAMEPLHEGAIGAGDEIPFKLRLPDDAYPNWDDPSTSKYGELEWSIVVDADIATGLDTITTHSIPIDDGADWTGPEPSGERELQTQVDSWDVELIPERWALRRGEDLDFTLRIGKPQAERPKLEVGLMCQAYYKIETKRPDESGYRRETNYIDLVEQWPGFDPSAPEQTITVTIPKDAPFSYQGTAFGFNWSALAREKRRFFQSDAGRVARLEVMP